MPGAAGPDHDPVDPGDDGLDDDDDDEPGSWFALEPAEATLDGADVERDEAGELGEPPRYVDDSDVEDRGWVWLEPVRRKALLAVLGERAWLDELDAHSLAGLSDVDGEPMDPMEVAVYAGQLLESQQELLADDELSTEDFARLHWVSTDLAVISRNADDATGGTSIPIGTAASVLDRLTRETDTMLRRRITPRRDGTFRMRWSAEERELVRTAVDRLDAVVDPGHEALARLYPAAYGEDEQRSAEYAAVAHHELIDSRRAAFATVRGCLTRNVINAEELGALMRSLNDVRLVLGTQLDVTEEDDWLPSPDSPAFAEARTYYLLTALLGDVIAAMRRTL